MHYPALLKILGMLIFFLGLSMIIPLGFSLLYGGSAALPFLISFVVTTGVGGATYYGFRNDTSSIRRREAFAVVSLGWIFSAAFACLPFIYAGTFEYEGASSIDIIASAYFETMSGFTTTGASVMVNIEAQPEAILFWRSMTHFYGGIGIIVLFVAVLPLLGVGGRELFFTEAPGPIAEGLQPKIVHTARTVIAIYIGMVIIQTILLMLGGMTLFDATCHAFGTMATGGFSTKNTSVAHYDSVYIDSVITFFMFLAGANFSLYYMLFKGSWKAVFRDAELRYYCGFMAGFTLLISLDLYLEGTYESLATAFRYAAFQVVCIGTTTGFATADFDAWPTFCKTLLVFGMFVGGSAGSTAGGMKVIRVAVVFKHALLEVMRSFRPHKVSVLRMGKRVIDDNVRASIIGFFVLHLTIFCIGTVIMSLYEGMDVVAAPTAVIACLMNIGPGLGAVGPTENFAWIPTSGKFILSFFMLLGRLELYAVLVLFLPSFWQKS